MMHTHRIQINFTIIQFLLWFSWGTFGLFYIAHLEDLGYSSKLIALTIILSTIFGILGQYVLGFISDKTSKIKYVFLGALFLLILFVIGFGFAAKHLFPMIMVMSLIGFVWLPLESLLDSWILSTKGLDSSLYGFMRAGASFGFAIMTLFFGGFVIKYGYDIIVYAYVITAGFLWIMAFLTKTETIKEPHTKEKIYVKSLLKNKAYIAILIYSMLLFITHMGVNNFYIYIFKNVGGNASHIGISAAFAAFTEIFGFIYARRIISKIAPLKIFLIVGVITFFRVYLLTIATTPTQAILTAILQGVGFSLFLASFKLYVVKITPTRLLASAQTIAAGVTFGLSSIVASLLGGFLIDDFGIERFFDIMNLIALVALIYIGLLFLHDYKKRKSLTE
ncbi:MFS transporter [Petrocella atlantisensis]|nr:MFS transporter [Petrocella atlantisensis]